MRRFKLLISHAILACAFFVGPASAATFVESGGILIMEAESSPAAGDWSQESSIGGYAGNGYLVWNGADAFSEGSAGRGTITYNFRIEKAGNYELQWRSRITRGNNATEHNDSWVRFPSGQNISGEQSLNGWTKVFMSTLGRWAWQSATVDHVGRRVRQYFSAGDHTIQISGRSNGHAIDRISLFHYGDVSFSESAFDSMGQSGTTDGSGSSDNTEDASEPAEEPTNEETNEPEQDDPATPEPEEAPADETESSNVEAPSVSVEGAVLSWSAVDALGYNIHRGDGEWIETLPATQTQWEAPGAGTYYVVATGEGSWETWGRSDTVTVESADGASDEASLNLTAQVYSSSAIELFWSADYSVVRSFEIRQAGELMTVSDGRSYFADELTPGTSYDYEVTSIDAAGTVVETASISVTTLGGSSDAPAPTPAPADDTGFSVRAEVYSQSAVELFWSTDSLAADTSYQFDISLNGVLIDTTDGQSYYVQGLTAGGTYELQVSVLADGSVVTSDSVTVETLPADNQ